MDAGEAINIPVCLSSIFLVCFPRYPTVYISPEREGYFIVHGDIFKRPRGVGMEIF